MVRFSIGVTDFLSNYTFKLVEQTLKNKIIAGVRPGPGPGKKSIKDYFQKPELKKQPQKRKTIMSQMPTSVFTDPACLELIRKRDKDRDQDYCKEFEQELRHITPDKGKEKKVAKK